jgi:DNA polymerase III epsilon subunit-like protein
MNYQDILFLDFETTSVNPYTCQPTQLAAVVIHGRKLEIQNDSIFSSYIQPIFDEKECKKLGLDPITDEVLEKTHINIDDLKRAPSIKTVWSEFVQYVNKYNYKKSKWGAPIKAGMNIDKYDSIIIDRICGGHFRKARMGLDKLYSGGIIELNGVNFKTHFPEPYGFGPWDNERQEETLFFPRDSVDLLRILWMWTENMADIKSLSMDAVREWLGISTEGAHNAEKDVTDGAMVLIKFLKLHRHYAPKVKFKNSCQS